MGASKVLHLGLGVSTSSGPCTSSRCLRMLSRRRSSCSRGRMLDRRRRPESRPKRVRVRDASHGHSRCINFTTAELDFEPLRGRLRKDVWHGISSIRASANTLLSRREFNDPPRETYVIQLEEARRTVKCRGYGFW